MKRIIHTTGGVSEPYPRTTGGDQVVTIWPSPAAELADTHRALLRTMDWALILSEVERRGPQVCLHTICRFSTYRLPPGYPPLADADVPFDALEDTRS